MTEHSKQAPRSPWHGRTLAELDHEVLAGRLTPGDALDVQLAHRVMQPRVLPTGWHRSRCLLIDPALLAQHAEGHAS